MAKERKEAGRTDMKIRDLDVDEFKALIQEAVAEKLKETQGDPDQGLELQEGIKEGLERSLWVKAQGIPAEKVVKEIGLEW